VLLHRIGPTRLDYFLDQSTLLSVGIWREERKEEEALPWRRRVLNISDDGEKEDDGLKSIAITEERTLPLRLPHKATGETNSSRMDKENMTKLENG
jgi:hypothetical protein